MVEQHRLGAHHVAHGDDRKIQTPRRSGRRIGRSRTGAAHAAANHVRADNKIPPGIDRTPGSDHSFPPTRFAGHRVVVHRVLIAGERMANKHSIVALGVERAVGLVGDLQRREIDATVEPKRIIRRKAHQERMRMVRFAPAVGEVERRTSLGHVR